MADYKKYREYLASGEEIIKIFSIGDRYYWTNVIVFSLLSLVLIGIPFLWKVVHLRHSLIYILTNRRIIIREGILSTKTVSAPYDKITHLTVKEDFIQKVSYGIGDIIIHTAGAGPIPIELDLVKVENPTKVKNLIEELMTKERLEETSRGRKPLIRPLTS